MNSPLTASDSTPETIVVFPPDRSGIGALAVPPPNPVGYKSQSDGSLGVNINMVHGDRNGLLIYILSYLNMEIGDHIKVFIETKNAPVVEFPVTDAHFDSNGEAKNIPCYISAAVMESKFPPLLSEKKDIWVEVRRISDNSTEDSPHALLFFKRPAPGESDTDGGKPFNQGLKLPVASETIIDQTVINDGMSVTVPKYFNQQIGDTVVLAFGPLLLEIEVTALGDIEFELTPEMLVPLKPTNLIIVRWEVFDVVENSSGWSDALEIVFKPGIVLLVAPIFELADIDNVVHHDWLAGGPMPILITGVFAIGDVVVLLLEGVTEGGDPVSHSYSISVSAATRSLKVDVENFRVQNLIRGSCRATYTLTRAGKTQESKPADVTITGGTFTLGQPTVTPLENTGTVPVDTQEVKVQCADYWPLKSGATVQLLWQTVDNAGVPVLVIFRQIVTDRTLPIIFKVPAKYVGPYPGSSLMVQCAIINPNKVRVMSEPLPLKIGDEKVIELQPPSLVKPVVSPIDPLAHPDGVTVRIEFPEAREGDRARLIVVSPKGSETFPLVAFNSNNRINTLLTVAMLASWHGQVVHLRWNLNRGGKQIAQSPLRKFDVKKIADGDQRFPVSVIDKADSANVLDLNAFKEQPSVEFKSWPFPVGNYTVDIDIEGTSTFSVVRGGTLTPDEKLNGFSRAISREQLLLLKNNSAFRVKTTVYFNIDPQSKVVFPYSIPYVIKNAPPILSENFDNYGTNVIAVGGHIELASMTIRFIGGDGNLGITALSSILPAHGGPFAAIPGASSGQILEMHVHGTGSSQNMLIEFNWGYSYVQCYCRFVQHSNITVNFLNKDKQKINPTQYLANYPYQQLVSFRAPGNDIWFMQIVTPQLDLIGIDHFDMERIAIK
ncbi:hypothetical protein [Pseudomonas fitomaticsae]|uniref:Uncharacterized protein n=1 Tax=Pseudomonas fitomaticsae TaxID=2837969 RepID=A0ABY3Q6H4_9PSED|nr:hypothetical protein [Pseudomonas fitomaticsae]UFQ01753.1 hypothetical protein KJY40_08680 [Pseudomonas fitomaticsae]